MLLAFGRAVFSQVGVASRLDRDTIGPRLQRLGREQKSHRFPGALNAKAVTDLLVGENSSFSIYASTLKLQRWRRSWGSCSCRAGNLADTAPDVDQGCPSASLSKRPEVHYGRK